MTGVSGAVLLVVPAPVAAGALPLPAMETLKGRTRARAVMHVKDIMSCGRDLASPADLKDLT
jgi:hypothetical protein